MFEGVPIHHEGANRAKNVAQLAQLTTNPGSCSSEGAHWADAPMTQLPLVPGSALALIWFASLRLKRRPSWDKPPDPLVQCVTLTETPARPTQSRAPDPHLTGAIIQQRCTISAIHLFRNNYSIHFAFSGKY